MVGIDTKIARDLEGFLNDFGRLEVRVIKQSTGCGLRERAAAADGNDAVLRFQHIAHTRDNQRVLTVSDRKHRFQAAQHAVGAPILGEFHRRAHQVALMLFELGLKALEQGECVRGSAGKTREDFLVIQAPYLARGGLDHHIAERDLPITAQCNGVAAPHGKYGRAVKDFGIHNDGSRQRRIKMRASRLKLKAPPPCRAF